ncbi:hypothetical protein yc1106_01736 [Curvularia clavata]|uniref:Aflatoxin regulatory protein domain-containing protein n=1 Tax=Curvularia clavata TaxID=95742 RepID=A0A9Q8Z2C9_CURCL|nr:hypothetical protein yc1106_01736 [Curvularia clavata]
MNIGCNYSPSMRLGKPRKHRNLDGTVKREVSPVGSYGPLGARFDLIPRTTSHAYESSPEPTDPFFFGPSTPEFNYQDGFIANTFSGSRSPACSEGAVSLVSAWPNDEHMMYGNQTDVLVPLPQQLSQQHTPVHGHAPPTSMRSQSEIYPSLHAQHPSPNTSQQFLGMPHNMFASQEKALDSSSPMLAPLPTPPASASSSGHDCTLSAFQTLNNLYAPPALQAPAGSFTSTTDGSPSLESILSTNKAAVDNLYALLNCDCTSNPHFSATISLTITKILSWFQAIARAHDHHRSLPLSLETQMEIYTQPRALDTEAECAHRTNLVLAELCRIEKLIDKFAERYCRHGSTCGGPAELDIKSGVHLSMEASLRTRVRDTFRITMAVAPESVKRRMASSRTTHSRVRVNTV